MKKIRNRYHMETGIDISDDTKSREYIEWLEDQLEIPNKLQHGRKNEEEQFELRRRTKRR